MTQPRHRCPQQPRIKIARAGASWTVTLGECGGLEEQNKVCEARATVSLSVSPLPLVHRSVRCRDCRSDSIERRDINGSICSLVLRAENRMRNVADSCKMQASCTCESAGLNYVVLTFFPITGSFMHLLPSNTAAKDFFYPRMTEWAKEDAPPGDILEAISQWVTDTRPLRPDSRSQGHACYVPHYHSVRGVRVQLVGHYSLCLITEVNSLVKVTGVLELVGAAVKILTQSYTIDVKAQAPQDPLLLRVLPRVHPSPSLA
ncbi:hypothetical protein B0H14DRAFT_3778789 [Mycena olivaceomarginata]|nr:hypothetical protein B0H14DRAFT_3778789 [Mycena olivaceomarginata]